MSGDRAFDPSDLQVLRGLEAVRRRPEMYVGPLEDGAAWLAALRLALSWLYGKARSRCGARQSITLRDAQATSGPFRFEWSPARRDAPPFVAEERAASLGRLDNSGGAPNIDGLGVLNALSQELQVTATGRGFGLMLRRQTEASIRMEPVDAAAESAESVTLSFQPGPVLAPCPPTPPMLRGYLLCFSHARLGLEDRPPPTAP